MPLTVYLSGEIHSDWREAIARGVADAGLDVTLTAPVTDHAASDDCGVAILGPEQDKFWHDHKGAGINALRTRTLLKAADVVVVRFGDRYRQWNAAFDAGSAAALGKPLVTLHDPDLDHALKEVDQAAVAVARTPEQVVAALRYALTGALPGGCITRRPRPGSRARSRRRVRRPGRGRAGRASSASRRRGVLTVGSGRTARGDLGVRQPRRHQLEHLALAGGELAERVRGPAGRAAAPRRSRSISRRVTLGASSASPSATTRTAETSCSRAASLSRKPLAPARSAS